MENGAPGLSRCIAYINMGDFPASYVSLPEGSPKNLPKRKNELMKKHMLFTYSVPKYLQLSLGKIRVAGKNIFVDFGTKGDGGCKPENYSLFGKGRKVVEVWVTTYINVHPYSTCNLKLVQ